MAVKTELEFCKSFIRAVNKVKNEFGISEELATRTIEMSIKIMLKSQKLDINSYKNFEGITVNHLGKLIKDLQEGDIN